MAQADDAHALSGPKIGFFHVDAFPGWEGAPSYLSRCLQQTRAAALLEVGCGPNPTLPLSALAGHDVRYVISDLYPEELAKAPAGYEQRVLDLEAPALPGELLSGFDVIFSRMVNEHVRDGAVYHGNILKLLRPGGLAVHCSASLFTAPFLINRLVPEAIADRLLGFFAPRNQHSHGRFTAFYSWCRGPTPTMIAKFERLGYEVLEYNGYFGHKYYKGRLGALDKLEDAKTAYLLAHPNPHLCSYTTVVLRKR